MNGGTLLITIGLALVAIGLLVYAGAFGWFGHLPGDIRIERGNTQVFIPITSMVIVSIVLSVIVHIVQRFFG